MSISNRLKKLEHARANALCPACPSVPSVVLSKDGKDLPPSACPRCGREVRQLVITGVDPEAMYGPGGKAGWERTLRERERAGGF